MHKHFQHLKTGEHGHHGHHAQKHVEQGDILDTDFVTSLGDVMGKILKYKQ